MTTTAEHRIAAIGLMPIDTKKVAMISLLSARLYASQLGGNCCFNQIAVLQLTVDGYTSHVYCTYRYDNDWLWLMEVV